MDKTWLTLVGILDKWEREGGDLFSILRMNGEVLQYGLAQGFLTKERIKPEEKESDESCLCRAQAASSFFRETLGEDTGSVLNMTREQHLELIHRIENAAENVTEKEKKAMEKLLKGLEALEAGPGSERGTLH